MHPNVPAQGEPEWKFVARRIELMMLGLLVPEYVVALALSERIEAAQTAEGELFSIFDLFVLKIVPFKSFT